MKRSLSMVLLLACGILLLAGIVQLFELRYETGDIYPAYSSLRADPLGTMALYETLNELPGTVAVRDYSDGNELPAGTNTAYLHLAAGYYDWDRVPESLLLEVERFTKSGGRLVITFFPESTERSTAKSRRAKEVKSASPEKDKSKSDDKTGQGKGGTKPHKPDPDPPQDKDEEDAASKPASKKKGDHEILSLGERWGLHPLLLKLEAGPDDTYLPAQVTNRTGLALPPTLDWHTGVVFTNLGPAWTPIYMRGTNAVVIERNFGKGSVVFSTDSYFISNEAMLQDRHADFLAWLMGPNKRVYFDEAHLGLTESPGIAMLMRKYRLQGFLGGLALLAGLFLWKNGTSLAPLPDIAKQNDAIMGKEAYTGFVNLLRRNVPQNVLLATCFAEWKKSTGRGAGHSPARRKAVEDTYLAVADTRDPVKAYQALCAALHTSQAPQPAPTQPAPPVLNISHES